MNDARLHRATTENGADIVGSVYGQGPPIVLLHGAMADGEQDWGGMLHYLTDRFTCYLPSTRGRGLSGTHADPSSGARVGDVTAFVESVGEPVGLVGWSGGGMLALGAAARTEAVAAVAAYEPVVFDVIGDETRARMRRAVARMAECGAEGRAADATRSFLSFVANEEEVAALTEEPEALELAAQYLPVDLEEFRDDMDGGGPSPTAVATLERIRVPALLLHGSRTQRPWFTAGIRYVAEHVPHVTTREIDGSGHFCPVVTPERVAEELVEFFERQRSTV